MGGDQTDMLLAMVTVVIPAALITLIPARLILGLSGDLGTSDLLLDIGRWTAAYLLMSVIAFGLSAVLKSTIAPLSILVVLAIFVNGGFLQWPEGIRFLPDQTAMSLLGTPAFEVTALPPGIAALVLATWAAIATAGYVIALIWRDT